MYLITSMYKIDIFHHKIELLRLGRHCTKEVRNLRRHHLSQQERHLLLNYINLTMMQGLLSRAHRQLLILDLFLTYLINQRYLELKPFASLTKILIINEGKQLSSRTNTWTCNSNNSKSQMRL